jgi:ankyrin repeat protein
MVNLLIKCGADGGPALVLAAEKGHLMTVEVLLGSGGNVDLDTRDWKNATALILAAGQGHFEVVELLLDKGASPDLQDDLGRTALIMAAEIGHLAMVKVLLESGASVGIWDGQHKSAIDYAVLGESQEAYRLSYCSRQDLQDKERGALLKFFQRQNIQILEQLLLAGASTELKLQPSLQLTNHLSRILLLAIRGDPKTVDWIVRLWPDCDCAFYEANNSAYLCAVETGRTEILKILIKKSSIPAETMNSRNMRCWLFGDVIAGEQTETLKILIQAGLTTDLQNPDDSMRYVTEAAKKGYSTIFRLLMEADCSKEPRHITPLIYAALRNNVEALKGLLELGVGVDEANEFGQTALMTAAECGHVRALEMLIEAGANVNVEDKSGNMALFYAVETNPEPRVKYAKKNFDDYFGFIQNRCEVLKKLIAAGADTKLLKNFSILSLVEQEFERLNHLAMVLSMNLNA